MKESYTPNHETAQAALNEAVFAYGPRKAHESFRDPILSRSDRKVLYEATRSSLFDNLSTMDESSVNEYLSVLELMTKALEIDKASRSTAHLPADTAGLVEKVIDIGPQVTLELFSHPALTREAQQDIYEATKISFWETYEEGTPDQIEAHFMIINEMEAALLSEPVTTTEIETYFPPITYDVEEVYRPIGRTSLRLVEITS